MTLQEIITSRSAAREAMNALPAAVAAEKAKGRSVAAIAQDLGISRQGLYQLIAK